MIKYVNGCNGCAECIGCGRDKSIKILVCDCCETEDDLYEFDGEELCIDCIREKLTKVEIDE